MSLVVMKFGGTSVADEAKIKHVAKTIKEKKNNNNKIIVVVSAMAGVTNDLVKKSKLVSSNFDKMEYDVLLAAGEQISSSLLSGALIDEGINSRSWQSWQIPILTEGEHSNSRIVRIQTDEIIKFLQNGGVPVIPGFQGISKNLRLSTLGRGGSDATAIVVAKFFNADYCEIYTDVKGVYTTDPSINPKAKKIDKISYDEMLEMASLGAKVMQPSAVQAAYLNNIKVFVKSTFETTDGTKIESQDNIDYKKAITGVAYSKNDAKITLERVVDEPGVAAKIFEPFSRNNINVDMVIQNISLDGKSTDITFTIKREDVQKTIKIIEANKKTINYANVYHDNKVSKISIIGAGMISIPGVTYKMFDALAQEKINILAISTSEIKISVLISEMHTQRAVKVLHKIFDLG